MSIAKIDYEQCHDRPGQFFSLRSDHPLYYAPQQVHTNWGGVMEPYRPLFSRTTPGLPEFVGICQCHFLHPRIELVRAETLDRDNTKWGQVGLRVLEVELAWLTLLPVRALSQPHRTKCSSRWLRQSLWCMEFSLSRLDVLYTSLERNDPRSLRSRDVEHNVCE